MPKEHKAQMDLENVLEIMKHVNPNIGLFACNIN